MAINAVDNTFDPGRGFRLTTYAGNAVRFAHASQRRREHRSRLRLFDPVSAVLDTPADEHQAAHQPDLLQRITAAMDVLSPAQRRALELRYRLRDDHRPGQKLRTFTEVATAMGKAAPGSAHAHVKRALQRIRAAI